MECSDNTVCQLAGCKNFECKDKKCTSGTDCKNENDTCSMPNDCCLGLVCTSGKCKACIGNERPCDEDNAAAQVSNVIIKNACGRVLVILVRMMMNVCR